MDTPLITIGVGIIMLAVGIVIGTEFPLSGPRRKTPFQVGQGVRPTTARPPAPAPMRAASKTRRLT